MGSGHPEMALLACDLHSPKGPTLRRDSTSALPVLKCLIFLEQGVPRFCVSHFHFSLAPQIGELVQGSNLNANEEGKISTILLLPSL